MASDVRMYETHIPGFCYRRDGASRAPNAAVNNQSVDFQDLHDMLFTKSEIDIEKLLCLHLISAHKTDTLEAPPKSYKLFLSREQAPLERLVERSKKRVTTPVQITRLLPTYVLDVEIDHNVELKDLMSKEPVKDTRLTGKLIINDKILELCTTVMNALRKSNGKKMSELVELSRNPDKLKRVMAKTELQEFLRRLGGLNLISSCESFHLVPALKLAVVSIKLSTPTGVLEKLVLQIRKNVFQVPSVDSWSLALSESYTIAEQIEEVKGTTEAYVKPKVDHILGRIPEKRHSIDSVKESQEETNSEKDKISVTSSTKRRSSKYEQEDMEFNKYINRASKTLNRSPLHEREEKKTQKIVEEERDTYNINNSVNEEFLADIRASNTSIVPVSVPSSSSVHPESEHHLHSNLHTSCKACLEKYKQPHPQPKAPTLRRTSVPVLDETMVEKTDSMNKLSGLVDKNRNKLQYYEKRFSKDRENRQSLNKMRSSIASQGGSRKSSMEIVDLDKLDLAKIRQEIKENETKKKLDNFMKNQEVINKRNSK